MNIEDEAMEYARDQLMAGQVKALREHAETLSREGKSNADIFESLQRYCRVLNRWRATALGRVARRIDEPTAPSVELQ